MSDQDEAGPAGEAVEGKPESRRVPVPKRLRFEVFKRDRFTCQYCGRRAPEITLQVEHIKPVAKGGTNDLINLIAACVECNAGKSDILLGDDAAVVRQHTQLGLLQERREQQEMMLAWRAELENLQTEAVERVAEKWSVLTGYDLNDTGTRNLAKLLRKHSIAEVLDAMQLACDKHLEHRDGVATHDSVEKAFKAMAKIANFNRFAQKDPAGAKLRYIRGILRNRCSYCPEDHALQLLEEAYAAGVTLDDLQRIAKRARNWSRWRDDLAAVVERAQGDERLAEQGDDADAPAVTSTSSPEEVEILAFQAALFEQLQRLPEEAVWQLVGYAKGLNLLIGRMLEHDVHEAKGEAASGEDYEGIVTSLRLEGEWEASGFGDALGLARSNQREDELLALGEIDTSHLADLLANHIHWLPRAPYLTFDKSSGQLMRVSNPIPPVEAESEETPTGPGAAADQGREQPDADSEG